jgi:hypothetical protein
MDILLTRLAKTKFFSYEAIISSDQISGMKVAALVLSTNPPVAGYVEVAI